MGDGSISNLRSLLSWRYGISLPLKALFLTITVGLVFWVVLNHFQTESQKQIFGDYLLEELTKRTQSDWGRFDDYMRAQVRAGKLLVERTSFSHYVEHQEEQRWNDDTEIAVKSEFSEQPQWLPRRSLLRGLVRASHFLLLDSQGRIREIFHNGDQQLPDSILHGLMEDMVGSESRNTIRESDGQPFMLTRISFWDEQKQTRATLVLITLFDDEFLLNLQLQTQSEGILVFLGDEGKLIVASSRPDLVATGTLVETLEKKYLLMEKSYFDYGFSSDVFVQFATLTPISRIQELNRSISETGRTQRALAHVIMILVTMMIVIWLVGHIQEFTKEMLNFSRDKLGLESVEVKGGDQLQVMKSQFRLLANEIAESRHQESERKEELQEANKALWQSLVMVKRTQAQLVESEKMAALGGLVAGVAHEINTPVGIGITAASFLQRRSADTARLLADEKLKKSELDAYFVEAVESSDMILANLNRAAKLIRSFKQIAVDQASESQRSFYLKEYVDQVLTSFHHRLKSTTHSVSVSCPDELKCNSYPGVLSQIITNFIENSLVHGFKEKEAGKMFIDISSVDGGVVFRYKDNGEGMSDANRKHIFEPFFTTARGDGWSGLGMHIVYNLVTQTLGGTIECRSEPGAGVEFIITFPPTKKEDSDSS
jgi:signal transduction histidine kinase